MERNVHRALAAIAVTAMAALALAGCGGKTDNAIEAIPGADADGMDGNRERAGGLPAYEYPGADPLYAAVSGYVRDEFAGRYLQGDVTIPCPLLVAEDDGDRSDVKLYADFAVHNYTLTETGDTLLTVSGGSHPGLMHVARTSGGCVVTGFDAVGDGSNFGPKAKKSSGTAT